MKKCLGFRGSIGSKERLRIQVPSCKTEELVSPKQNVKDANGQIIARPSELLVGSKILESRLHHQ